MTDWFQERLCPTVLQAFARRRMLYRGRTQFQDVEIFENDILGGVLVLDGIVQATEKDEFIYHEMLVHVPFFAHGSVRNALIIGGGDGGVLRETLRHPVGRVTMVDIDGEVVELSKRFLPGLSAGAFEDARAEVIIGDGVKFVEETERRFDAIIVDSTDPIGPGEVLFRKSFYEMCARVLAEGGVIVTQNGVPFLQPEELRGTWRNMGEIFRHRGFYVVAVPTYYGGFMALAWGSDALDLSRPDEATRERARTAGFATRYYNTGMHGAAFALPQYVQDLLEPSGSRAA